MRESVKNVRVRHKLNEENYGELEVEVAAAGQP